MTAVEPVRRRAAAIIIRDELVLMVRERAIGPSGRHDGPEYLSLPGGGIEHGEDAAHAVVREVFEEVGLVMVSARQILEVPYPSGPTTVFRVEVEPGEPRLGVDVDLPCDCPRMVGLTWVPIPETTTETGGAAIPLLVYVV